MLGPKSSIQHPASQLLLTLPDFVGSLLRRVIRECETREIILSVRLYFIQIRPTAWAEFG
jgi:hypothetical protein